METNKFWMYACEESFWESVEPTFNETLLLGMFIYPLVLALIIMQNSIKPYKKLYN